MEYELIRQLVLEYLRHFLEKGQQGQDQVSRVLSFVGRTAYERQLWKPKEIPRNPELVGDMLTSEDIDKVKAVMWQLIILGVLVPGVRGYANNSWPHFSITEYGKNFLESEGSAPYDPEGYLSCIAHDSPNVDDVVMLYLTESLQCFIRANYIASVVMVGVAAEKVILNLINAFANSLSDDSKAATFRRKTRNTMIKIQFDELIKQLYPLKNQLPDALSRDLETYLGSIFNLIRSYRNEAGHPSGIVVSREIAYSNLQIFRYFSKNVHHLIQYLSSNQI
jgi:hypothetical protein